MGIEESDPPRGPRRALLVLVLLVVAALIALILVIVLADEAETPTVDTGAGAKEVARAGGLARTDAFVLLVPSDAAAELARLRGALDASELVDAYLYLPYGWWTFWQALMGGSGAIPEGAVEACPEIVAPALLVAARDADAGREADFDALVAPSRRVTGFGFPRFGVSPRLPEIFMDVSATPAQVAAIAARLETDPDIVSVEHVTKASAHEEFRRIFAEQPDLVENIDPDSLPESFRVDLVDGADPQSLAQRYSGASGVDEVVARSWDEDFDVTQPPEVLGDRDGTELEIFMELDADSEQVQRLLDDLATDRRVESYRYLTKEDAYREFVRIFDEADFLANVDPDLLPESIRVEAEPGDVPALESAYAGRPGVDEVVTAQPPEGFEGFCPPALRDP